VKGLDFALLEQNKAKAVQSETQTGDDDLEAAFETAKAEPAPTIPRKRTREEVIAELKRRREQQGTAKINDTSPAALERDITVQSNKFKPIGFKPITEKKVKKKKKSATAADGEGEPKKRKKRKVEPQSDVGNGQQSTMVPVSSEPTIHLAPVKGKASETNGTPPPPADFDIFADAGEYDFDDDDNEEADVDKDASDRAQLDSAEPPRRGWFEDDEEQTTSPRPPTPPSVASTSQFIEGSEHPEEGEHSEEESQRLVPLSGSAMPSIKDVLAMDAAAEKEEKRRLRKAKQKGEKIEGEEKKKMTSDAKVDRDYKRLILHARSLVKLSD
jgi:IK cytokine